MSKLMIILGIIVAAAGAVIGALIYVSPGQMQVLGLTPEVTAIMFVGGLGLIGLGGIIAALDKNTRELRALLSGQGIGQAAAGTAATTVTEFSEVTASPPPFPVPTPVVEPPPSVSKIDALIEESKAETSRAVAGSKETIAALDKAKDELKDALDVTEPEPPPPAEEPPAEEPEAEDTQLFVVEERLIRGRPARVLSDGTVEAETDDGWMRFENLEHLEEYLDAMSPGQA